MENNYNKDLSDELYRNQRGEIYYAQRHAVRCDDVQKERANYFKDLENNNAVILDFGCGNGGILSFLKATTRIGIEVNPYSAEEAKQRLNVVTDNLSVIENESVDVVISFHALEHVDDPAFILRELRRTLKTHGVIRIIVPCEMPFLLAQHRTWLTEDIDMHLYTWSPLTLGNLLTVCGFTVDQASLAPDSKGGRLGRMFKPGGRGQKVLAFIRGTISGKFHTVVTARKLA